MDIEANNAASVVALSKNNISGVDIDVYSERDVTTEKPEDGARHEGTEQEELPPELPYSKARLIGLVVTVTGAAFLNTL